MRGSTSSMSAPVRSRFTCVESANRYWASPSWISRATRVRSSATARPNSALRRYFDGLTADGELEVELEVDRTIRLAPDEQIEIFRIVQEGLANVRKHANATRAEVTIGLRQFGERYVTIADDGDGFAGDEPEAGQGLKNMRARAESIEGGFSLRSAPGRGTALEVVLRT